VRRKKNFFKRGVQWEKKNSSVGGTSAVGNNAYLKFLKMLAVIEKGNDADVVNNS